MDALLLAKMVEESYRRYLKTTFYFRDPILRASFGEVLDSGHLAKGPYLEATPVYKQGQSPRQLFNRLLGINPDEGFLRAVHGDRALYQHQEQAIQKVFDGKNVIVATGTGSGKTEAFLYPILLHLYQEFQNGKLCPGVRALVLYPMNALANDQRERLGRICQRLEASKSPFQFTFGQYIGETPEDECDSQRHAHDHILSRLPGELVFRSEMRKEPPHVLLTNYSMLEYLLLRPQDSLLFDNGRARWWTFIVLDEAHQYRGSRGIEMAMLTRRLKRRLIEGGRAEPFRCIATSATLLGGEKDKAAVARYAGQLFGEEFKEGQVILESEMPIPSLGQGRLAPEAYRTLTEFVQGGAEKDINPLTELAATLRIPCPKDKPSPELVTTLLHRDSRSAELLSLVTKAPADVRELAERVFGDIPSEQRAKALAELIQLLQNAKMPGSGTPFFSPRYHLFLRALEGAFVSYWPRKQVFLERKATGGDGTAFEVALCRGCGQHYFVGPKNFRRGKLLEAIRDPGHPDFGATFFLPLENSLIESLEDEDTQVKNKQLFYLCVQCGLLEDTNPSCLHNNSIRVLRQDPPADEDRSDQMGKCGHCGYSAGGRDPVRELIHGTDGPHAVVVTTLHCELSTDRKKVLAFADGRQEAAFFAWYLQETYKDILTRNLILRVAKSFEGSFAEGISLATLASRAFQDYSGAFAEKGSDDEPTIRKNIWRAIYRELLTPEQRISLEGVGLVRWVAKWPDWLKSPELLKSPPWSLSEPEARDLMLVLLGTMRSDGAVELLTEKAVSLNWGELGLQMRQVCFRPGAPARPKGFKFWPVRSWDGVGQHGLKVRNKRTEFLAKLLMSRGRAEDNALEEASETLRALWLAFQECELSVPSAERLLLPVLKYDAKRLNPRWMRLHPWQARDELFRCRICGQIQPVSVDGLCPRRDCRGSLEGVRLEQLDVNHYRVLYQAELPRTFRVEEHTAQLDKEKAREFQREFRAGKIHVLSCSTTFELGVDLGDLDTVFLRNVPPEAFNYAQRVGRVGRRSGYPGFAITFCRRGPHDLYHYADPQRILKGKVQPPTLSLQNEKIVMRHVTAMALSAFFHAFPERFTTVASFVGDLTNPSGLATFHEYLTNHQASLEAALAEVVPRVLLDRIGLSDGSWVANVTSGESRLAWAESELSSDYCAVKTLENTAAQAGEYDTAKWAKLRAKTIAEEDVLSFLSRKAVIPKYGFPVDVVELDTQKTQQTGESMEISLQRDLAIALSEFAPTSRLVANKKEWMSYGLKRIVGKEWPRKQYKRCSRHNVFFHWEQGEPEPPDPCGHVLPVMEYVIPRFGFVTNRDKPTEPTGRTARVFTTRPYFAGSVGPDPGSFSVPPGLPLIRIRKASPGLMVVLCEGRRGSGFFICRHCGAGFRTPPKCHSDPQGVRCTGTLSRVALGHEFVTDVLQIQFLHPVQTDEGMMSFTSSLAFAVVEGAASPDVLEVPSSDLSATVAWGSEDNGVPPIILYDNVPGGAGLVARLEDESIFRATLRAALNRVSGRCGCDESTSCYGCLRSYRNQFVHQSLRRGPVKQYLETVLSRWS